MSSTKNPVFSRTLIKGEGGKNIWKIEVFGRNGKGVIIREWGVRDGKIQKSEKVIEKGKNIGKKNETTAVEQATSEAKSLADKKAREQISSEDGELEGVKINFRPMLLKKWADHHHKFEPPFYVQPKYDGVRAVVYLNKKGGEKKKKEEKTKLVNQYKTAVISRKGKEISILPILIRKELKRIVIAISKTMDINPEELYLDGELMSFECEFEKFTGVFRKTKNLTVEQEKILESSTFVLFDFYCEKYPDMGFKDRWKIISENFPKVERVKLAPLKIVKLKKEIDVEKYIKEGYEGAVIRMPDAPYKPNKRVDTVLKLKKDNEEDGTIIGFKEGLGKEKGMVVWEVKLENGEKTWARPKGTEKVRRGYFKNAKKYIGKPVTLIFQDETIYGKKRFVRAEFRLRDMF
jgi:ATP-dependent DNA ligase